MRVRLDVCIGCIIAGTVITVIGLSAASGGFPEATWEIMGSTDSTTCMGLAFRNLGHNITAHWINDHLLQL